MMIVWPLVIGLISRIAIALSFSAILKLGILFSTIIRKGLWFLSLAFISLFFVTNSSNWSSVISLICVSMDCFCSSGKFSTCFTN